MKRLHIPGAVVALALLTAPAARPRRNRPAGIWRKARPARSSKKSSRHQPDRSDGDRRRPRLSRRHRRRHPDRHPAAAAHHAAGQPGARARHRRDVGPGRHDGQRRADLRRADDVLERPQGRPQRRRRRGAADDVVPGRGRHRHVLQHLHPARQPEPHAPPRSRCSCSTTMRRRSTSPTRSPPTAG